MHFPISTSKWKEEYSVPQSRHRKIVKAKKRPRATTGHTISGGPQTATSRNIRIIAIALVAIIAVGAAAYVFTHRGTTGPEITTPSGLRYVELVQGTGATPQKGQTVTVHYIGSVENGKQFENSRESGQPANFQIGVGKVIKGWDEALMTMKVGGKRKLIIPPSLGYGRIGRPPDIPGNATLIFEVELLDVK